MDNQFPINKDLISILEKSKSLTKKDQSKNIDEYFQQMVLQDLQPKAANNNEHGIMSQEIAKSNEEDQSQIKGIQINKLG